MKPGEVEQQALQGISRQHASRERRSHKGLWFLVILLAIVLIGGGFIYWALFWRAYHSTLFLTSMEKIQADPAVQKELGMPIAVGCWPAPSARWDASERDLRWPLRGPQGTAKAHVNARLMMGQWETVELEVMLPDGRRLAIADKSRDGNDAPVYVPPSQTPAAKSKANDAPAPTIQMMTPPTDDAVK